MEALYFLKYIVTLCDLCKMYCSKNGADEDASLKGDSPSSTETDSGVSEGCSDNGMSTEEEDMDNAVGGVNSVDGIAGMKKVEPTEDLFSSDVLQNMKVNAN